MYLLPGDMWSADLHLLQRSQSAVAVRQRSQHSTFPQRRPMYVWNGRHLAHVGKNYVTGLRRFAGIFLKFIHRFFCARVLCIKFYTVPCKTYFVIHILVRIRIVNCIVELTVTLMTTVKHRLLM